MDDKDDYAVSNRALLLATMEMINALSVEILRKRIIVQVKTNPDNMIRELWFHKGKVRFEEV